MNRVSPVIVGDHVTLESGTGCVHTAPGFGVEDFEVCKNYPEIGIVVPVDAKGLLTAEAGKYKGLTTAQMCIRDRSSAVLKTGKATSDIQIMAVTKTVPVECINDVFEQGVSLFGENRAQELCQKYEDYSFTSDNIHFIGTLQSNKVRQIIDKVSCIESVNSVSLATEINKRAQAINKDVYKRQSILENKHCQTVNGILLRNSKNWKRRY